MRAAPWWDMVLLTIFYHGEVDPTMTNEELAAAIQAGDREKLLELWTQVNRFTWKRVNRWAVYHQNGMEPEDLMQVGFLALLDALNGWNEPEGKFITWYALKLKAALTEAVGIRTQRDRLDPINHAVSLDVPVTDGEESLTLADLIPDPADIVEMVAERDLIHRRHEAIETALHSLPADQEATIRAKYYRNERVDNKAHNAALRALRNPRVSRTLKENAT